MASQYTRVLCGISRHDAFFDDTYWKSGAFYTVILCAPGFAHVTSRCVVDDFGDLVRVGGL